MDVKYFDKIIHKLSQYEDEELISSQYWDIIYTNLFLTHELLKEKKFTQFDKLNSLFFKEEIICSDLIFYDNPPYEYISPSFLNSLSFWTHILEKDHIHISKIPKQFLKDNTSFCLWICEKFSSYPVMNYFPDDIKNDFDLAYFAVTINPENFKCLNKELKNNPYTYEIIFKNKKIKSSDYFLLSGEDIRSNYKFAKRSIIENPSTFKLVEHDLKDNLSFFIDMLSYSDNILQFASDKIKNNELTILASIEKNPLSIEFVNEQYKSSIPFILSIHDYVKDCHDVPQFFRLLPSSVFNNEQFVQQYFNLIVIYADYYLLGDDIKSNYLIMKDFIFKDINSFLFASSDLKNNIGFIRECYNHYNQQYILKQFDIDSPQSSIFNMFDNEQLNDILFIQQLYQEFKPIFKEVVFPVIQRKKTILTEQLSNEINMEQGIIYLLEKFELKNKLENQLHYSIKQKNNKI